MKETTQIEDNIGKKYLKLYGICVIIMLVAPIFFMFYRFPYEPYNIIFNGYTYLTMYFLGGWIGLVLILISMYNSYYLVTRRTVMIGFLGCAFIGFNYLYLYIMMMMASSPYSGLILLNVLTPILLLISLIGFCSINLRLYHSIIQPKEKRANDIRSNLIISTLSILYVTLVVLSLLFFITMSGIYYYGGTIIFVFIIVDFILIAISLYSLIRELKIRQSIAFGITGIFFLWLSNYMIILNLSDNLSILIRYVLLFLMLVLNITLLRYRTIEPSPLPDRMALIKESDLYKNIKRNKMLRDDKSRQSQGTVERTPKKIKSKNIVSAKEVVRRLTPEELEEKRMTESEVGIERKEFMCVVHKGEIDGPIYLCPYCHTLYCQKCATALKEKDEKCWSCESEINL